MRARLLLAFTLLMSSAGAASTQPTSELALGGTLRVGVLLSNPVLVTKRPDGGLSGVSIELGRMIAAKLGVRYAEVRYTIRRRASRKVLMLVNGTSPLGLTRR